MITTTATIITNNQITLPTTKITTITITITIKIHLKQTKRTMNN